MLLGEVLEYVARTSRTPMGETKFWPEDFRSQRALLNEHANRLSAVLEIPLNDETTVQSVTTATNRFHTSEVVIILAELAQGMAKIAPLPILVE
jgi:hypothetical protein